MLRHPRFRDQLRRRSLPLKPNRLFPYQTNMHSTKPCMFSALRCILSFKVGLGIELKIHVIIAAVASPSMQFHRGSLLPHRISAKQSRSLSRLGERRARICPSAPWSCSRRNHPLSLAASTRSAASWPTGGGLLRIGLKLLYRANVERSFCADAPLGQSDDVSGYHFGSLIRPNNQGRASYTHPSARPI